MGQIDIYNFLKRKPTIWFTYKEISLLLGVRTSTICVAVKKLEKFSFVEVQPSINVCGGNTPYKVRLKNG